MSLATLTSKGLARVQKLIERKEALAQQIADIDRELGAIESGALSARMQMPDASGQALAKPGRRGRPPRGGRGRGYLKEQISAELQSAGKEGMKVKDLAAKLGTGYGNITTFFQTTGKNIKEIKKIAPARYAWVG